MVQQADSWGSFSAFTRVDILCGKCWIRILGAVGMPTFKVTHAHDHMDFHFLINGPTWITNSTYDFQDRKSFSYNRWVRRPNSGAWRNACKYCSVVVSWAVRIWPWRWITWPLAYARKLRAFVGAPLRFKSTCLRMRRQFRLIIIAPLCSNAPDRRPWK